jgi:hypothetical protein
VGDLKFKIDDFSIKLINNQNLFILKSNISQPNLKLLHFNCSKSSIWISVYAKDRHEFENNFIKIGQGYVMEANIIAEFTAKNKKGYELLSNIKHLELDENIHVQERICLVEHFVKDREPIILTKKPDFIDFDRNLVFPSDLPEEGKKLYDRIENLGNSDIDKKLIEAINFSLYTKDCLLYERLKEKKLNQKDPNMTYLRVPFGYDVGASGQPGQPIVLEIWPKGHYSPVHNHGDAVAVIKLLSGTLKSEWYNPLSDNYNEKPKVIKSAILHKNDLTWMTPCYYQTHKLISIDKDKAGVSIQGYAHIHSSNLYEKYKDFFNFILPPSPKLIEFYPNRDFIFDFKEFLNITISELDSKNCKLGSGNIFKFN